MKKGIRVFFVTLFYLLSFLTLATSYLASLHQYPGMVDEDGVAVAVGFSIFTLILSTIGFLFYRKSKPVLVIYIMFIVLAGIRLVQGLPFIQG